MRRFRPIPVLVMALVITIVFVGTSAVRGEDPYHHAPIYEGNALALDAKGYADEHGLSLDEAIHRLQLQQPARELNAQLVAHESRTFAGAWIQHTPEFRLVVQFTDSSEETLQPYMESNPLADLVEVRTATVSLIELQAIQEALGRTILALDVPTASGINVFENRVELYVVERARFEAALQASNITLPEHVEVITVSELGSSEADIYAGLTLYITELSLVECTSGFAVQNGSGTKGITTSAHCKNSLSYNGITLPFQESVRGGQYDVQWHTTPSLTPRNLMFDGTYNRYVYATKHRHDQMINEYVCKYGVESKYTCGYIIDKHYKPPCSEGYCYTSTFIRVHRDGVDLSIEGDSGGPWFFGNTAYGIHTGGIGNDSYYMAINYISYIGLSVLTN